MHADKRFPSAAAALAAPALVNDERYGPSMVLEALGLHTSVGWLAVCLVTSVAALLRQHASGGGRHGNNGRWGRRRSPSPQQGEEHCYHYGNDREFRVSEYRNGNVGPDPRHRQHYYFEEEEEQPSGWRSPVAPRSEHHGSVSNGSWQQGLEQAASERVWDARESGPYAAEHHQSRDYAGSLYGEGAEEIGCADAQEVGEVPPRLLDPGSLVCLFTAQGELVTVTKEGRHWGLRTIASGREASWARSNRDLSLGDATAARTYEEGVNVASVSFTNGYDDGVKLPFFPIESIFVVLRDGDQLGFRALGAEGRTLQAVRAADKPHRVCNYNFGSWERWEMSRRHGLINVRWRKALGLGIQELRIMALEDVKHAERQHMFTTRELQAKLHMVQQQLTEAEDRLSELVQASHRQSQSQAQRVQELAAELQRAERDRDTAALEVARKQVTSGAAEHKLAMVQHERDRLLDAVDAERRRTRSLEGEMRAAEDTHLTQVAQLSSELRRLQEAALGQGQRAGEDSEHLRATLQARDRELRQATERVEQLRASNAQLAAQQQQREDSHSGQPGLGGGRQAHQRQQQQGAVAEAGLESRGQPPPQQQQAGQPWPASSSGPAHGAVSGGNPPQAAAGAVAVARDSGAACGLSPARSPSARVAGQHVLGAPSTAGTSPSVGPPPATPDHANMRAFPVFEASSEGQPAVLGAAGLSPATSALFEMLSQGTGTGPRARGGLHISMGPGDGPDSPVSDEMPTPRIMSTTDFLRFSTSAANVSRQRQAAAEMSGDDVAEASASDLHANSGGGAQGMPADTQDSRPSQLPISARSTSSTSSSMFAMRSVRNSFLDRPLPGLDSMLG